MTLAQLMSLVSVANQGERGGHPKAAPGSVADLAMLATMKVG